MSERTAKRLRRQQTEEHVPETNWSMGRNRRSRRSLTYLKDRTFTVPGPQVRVETHSGDVFYKQAVHIVQDYSHQRHVIVGSNHQRMMARKKYRIDLAKAVEGAKVASDAPH